VRTTVSSFDHRIVDFEPDQGLNDSKGVHDMGTAMRLRRWLLLGAVAALALGVTSSTSAAAAKTVNGTVGPGFTIGLTLDGKNVTKLKAGVPYRFVISDRADIHDFHLIGPGFSRVLTSVEFVGTKTFVLQLKKGTYHFLCDPHASIMFGRFQVS
jgi:plastocyanin